MPDKIEKIIAEIKEEKKHFVKEVKYGKITKIDITDFVCSYQIKITMEEAKKALIDNPNLNNEFLIDIFENYD